MKQQHHQTVQLQQRLANLTYFHRKTSFIRCCSTVFNIHNLLCLSFSLFNTHLRSPSLFIDISVSLSICYLNEVRISAARKKRNFILSLCSHAISFTYLVWRWRRRRWLKWRCLSVYDTAQWVNSYYWSQIRQPSTVCSGRINTEVNRCHSRGGYIAIRSFSLCHHNLHRKWENLTNLWLSRHLLHIINMWDYCTINTERNINCIHLCS